MWGENLASYFPLWGAVCSYLRVGDGSLFPFVFLNGILALLPLWFSDGLHMLCSCTPLLVASSPPRCGCAVFLHGIAFRHQCEGEYFPPPSWFHGGSYCFLKLSFWINRQAMRSFSDVNFSLTLGQVLSFSELHILYRECALITEKCTKKSQWKM